MNYYAKAMDIIGDPTIDFRKICVNIAKSHPSVLVKASPKNSTQLDAQQKVKDCLEASANVIEAIKLYRRLTGLSLREAKDFVDSIR